MNIQEALAAAVAQFRAGRPADAASTCRQILSAHGDRADVLNLLAIVQSAQGQNDTAAQTLRRAIALQPKSPDLFNNLGRIHANQGRTADAITAWRQALELAPNHAEALNNLGVALRGAGQLDAAIETFRRAIAVRQGYPEAHHNLAIALMIARQPDAAIPEFRRAIALRPAYPEALTDLGSALRENRQPDAAVTAFRQALTVWPEYTPAMLGLGIALKDLGQADASIVILRQAIAVRPNFPAAYYRLGTLLRIKNDLDGAAAAFQTAIAQQPDHADSHNDLGSIQKDQGDLDAALASFDRAIALDNTEAAYQSNRAYAIHFHPDFDAAAILREAQRWDALHAAPLRRQILPHTNDPNPDRRLRIGFISPDLRWHVVGLNLLPIFLQHDRQQFELYCYADVRKTDEFTARFQAGSDHWRDIVDMPPAKVAQLIRDDRIDILVDLSLHMGGNLLPVFARKPAPVQVTYLGYCSTTGVATMDYRLSDPFFDDAASDLSVYSEQTVRLPTSYWCYQPLAAAPAVSPPPAADAGFVTFGCLNSFSKVSPAAQKLWAQILAAVPNSRLILNVPAGSAREPVRQRFTAAGITADRLEFVASVPWDQYVRTYERIDIALDPFPYGGGITSCDALYMGVPLITLRGKTSVGRGGVSILSNIGLTDLIAQSPDDYLQIAAKLAADLPRLTALRASMRQRMTDSPLMDAKNVTREIEAAYRLMWQNWCDDPKRNDFATDEDTLRDQAMALRAQGRRPEALAAFAQIVSLHPDSAAAHSNLGSALHEAGRLDEAVASFRAAIALAGDFALAHNNLASALKDQGLLDASIQSYTRAMTLRPDDPTYHSNRIYTLLFHPDYDAAAILNEHRQWDRLHAQPLRAKQLPHKNDPAPDRPLRIGYVSPDFCDHVVGRNLLPVLQRHDRAQFQAFCYSNVSAPDPFTDRFRAAAQWRDIAQIDDDQAAEQIRADQIDVLVDLSLHLARNRLLVFARKPAPVQVTFAGYPGTTGLAAIDYRLTDPHLDPPGTDADYTEQSLRLPETFWCYDPAAMDVADASPPGPLPALTTGHVTFGCLSNFCKVSNATLDLWAAVLRAVPNSRLLILAPVGSARQRVTAQLAEENIDPARLAFVDYAPRAQYLLAYDRIDIALDTLPYNGHTTSLDALWKGVPVVTQIGKTVVGRAALSQLTNLNLENLAAQTPDQFIQIAAALATDLPRLSNLRQTLRQRMQQSPLTSADRFTRNIESIYRQIWRTWSLSQRAR